MFEKLYFIERALLSRQEALKQYKIKTLIKLNQIKTKNDFCK